MKMENPYINGQDSIADHLEYRRGNTDGRESRLEAIMEDQGLNYMGFRKYERELEA